MRERERVESSTHLPPLWDREGGVDNGCFIYKRCRHRPVRACGGGGDGEEGGRAFIIVRFCRDGGRDV